MTERGLMKTLKKLRNVWSSENVTKLDYMNNHSNGSLTEDQLESMYNVHKEQDMRRIKILKRHLLNVSDQLKSNSKEIGICEDVYNSDRRYFTHGVVQASEYRQMVESMGKIYQYMMESLREVIPLRLNLKERLNLNRQKF